MNNYKLENNFNMFTQEVKEKERERERAKTTDFDFQYFSFVT
jgi:hypothetical protein